MQVNVINENNVEVSIDPPQTIVVEVDQGKAGRGITNISYQQEGEYYYLVVTYTDGTTEQLGPLIITGAAVSLLGGTAGAIAYQSAPDNTTFLTLGTPNQVLVAGTTAPEYKTLAAGNGIQITSSSTSLTISAPETGTVTSVNASGGTTGMGFSGGPITSSGTLTLNGTLNVANGGTGATNIVGTSGVNAGGNGGNSVVSGSGFTTQTSIGGGAGRYSNNPGANGGSGGGGVLTDMVPFPSAIGCVEATDSPNAARFTNSRLTVLHEGEGETVSSGNRSSKCRNISSGIQKTIQL